MWNLIKRFNAWLSNTKPIRNMDHFFLYGCFEGEEMTPEEVEDMKKYWKYQENPNDPELKEFGEEYAKKLKKEQWEYDKKVYITCIVYIVVCSALLYAIYSSITWK